LSEEAAEAVQQTRLNIYRNRTKAEEGKKIISGFPLKDPRHTVLKVPFGYVDGKYVGFMDDGTPVRIRADAQERVSSKPESVVLFG
jgi:hypothetical protein